MPDADPTRSDPPAHGAQAPSSPAPRIDGDARRLERARRAVATIPPSRTQGVLIVEDDPDLQWALARMLTVRGNRVVGTSSAEGAMELIKQWPVDLVLVDDRLPGMSGVELVRRLHQSHPEIPVVLMASPDDEPPLGGELDRAVVDDDAAASTRDPAAAREPHPVERLASVVAVITKPFRMEAIVELLQSFPKGELDLLPAD